MSLDENSTLIGDYSDEHAPTPVDSVAPAEASTNRQSQPEPFGATFQVRGRPSEITQLVDEVEGKLRRAGWLVEVAHSGSSPLRSTRLALDDQWLLITVAASNPHQLRRPSEYELCVSGLARDHGTLHDLVAALPFTPFELEALARDMPLIASIAERISRWLPSLDVGERPLSGHGAIFTIHHQTDFVLLLEKALELGVDPALVTVIDKEYRYKHSRRVDAHVRGRLGIPVYRYSELNAGISEHIRRVDAAKDAAGSESWTPTLVVDDGGYVLPCLLRSFEPYLSFFKGVVEQTTSGIWKLSPFSDLKVPIFSVAESELKASVEAHGVAQAALTNLRRILPHEKFDGRRAVVVGYGNIGQALAELLRRHNVEVYVVDSAASMRVTARERGFHVGAVLPELIARVRPRYVFACAKPGAVDGASLRSIENDCALVSLTSRDEAFDKRALAELAEAQLCGTVGTKYQRYNPDCTLLLVADGYPVNFHFAESMPNQQSDLVMASLLVGAVSLARATPSWPEGNDPERANAVLNEGTLLDDFLELEPPLAGDILLP